MDVRLATPADAGSLVVLAVGFRNHFGRDSPTEAQFLEGVNRLLLGDDAEFYLGTIDGQSAGYVLQRFRYSMWAQGTEATLEDLFVDPARRQHGAGQRLVEFAIARARARPCTTVCLDTNENNPASTRIYTRLGFSPLSRHWNGRQIFFRLKLAP